MEVIRITFIVYEWNKSYIWKFKILKFHRSVPPLFCDFIIAYIFAFFNWHFNRSFQKIFVEQGEVSATFGNRIYIARFLWYNKNVGACAIFTEIALFIGIFCKWILSEDGAYFLGYGKPETDLHIKKAGNARRKSKHENNPWLRFATT